MTRHSNAGGKNVQQFFALFLRDSVLHCFGCQLTNDNKWNVHFVQDEQKSRKQLSFLRNGL
jgi:hypothetical protein